jgi:hypothetical protein
VAGAYRVILIRELEKKVLVPPIDIYYSKLWARHIRRTYSSPAGVFIQEQYKIIRKGSDKGARKERSLPK